MKKSADKRMNTVRGFTLIEVVVAMFIFVIIMTTVSGIFGRAFQGYRGAKAIQRDLEAAQYAINLMAKSLRTSSIISNSPTSVNIYDHSQDKCIVYRFDSDNKLKISSANPSFPGDKDTCTFSGTLSDMTTGYVAGNFLVVPSLAGIVGKVTVSIKVCPPTGCTGSPRDEAKIQTSVSLRDYVESGL